ncbi:MULTISPECIES: molybdopterin cofactor-binding domain-containing protein [Paracoccus]|uniref:xanthine dehydrogenase family protein molybdopterin-binding subunit n=1 Tax=Paracoccus TaxID=265 RepID=UPI00086C6975|nr:MULTISPECIES: molybdopterin cofactor-binding domain-containing protein [Paracoccus]ODT60662.1 MAG: isoquinoline 1-oxidoreductase [Paracoccus sp. SCN 68-21]
MSRAGLSRAGRIARRGFLIGSVAVAGGVAFGAWRYTRPLPDPFAGTDAGALNPYVLIDADGVTLVAPRADKGQGARWLQAALIAEELDIDPATARIIPGPVSATYYNRALIADFMPFAPTDTGWLAETARGAADIPARLLGWQMTGGSSSTADGFDKLRQAGAVARETLKQAAATRHGLSRADLDTADGAVILPDGTRIPYPDLAVDAARLEPVTDIVLRDRSQWRWLGQPMQRADVVAKSTGTQVYGIDLVLPDMLHATVRMAPWGGTVARLDPVAAEGMQGVLRVLPITGGVAVLARDTWSAMQAAAALGVTFTPPDTAGDQDAIWAALEATHDAGAIDTRRRDDGDVDAAIAPGDFAAEYRVPFLAHAPLEPMNATVLVTGDACTIWAGTQVPDFAVARAAALTGLPESAIRMENQMIGGSFGRRLEIDFIAQAVEIAMAVPGRPVKLTWSREEDFAHDQPRPAQIARVRGHVTADGVQALDLTVASPSVIASWFGRVSSAPPGGDVSITTGAWDQPFAIPHFRVTGLRAPETVPVSSWRSVGASSNGFFFGTALDEMFAQAGIDPLEGLLRLCDHAPSRAVLEGVRDLSGWTGRDAGQGRGRGVAFCLSFGVPCAQVVEVQDTPQGIRLTQAFAVADVGIVLDPVNADAQLSGGMLFGLGHAMNCELTYRGHAPDQTNFHAYEGMRMHQTPAVQVRLLENGPLRGLGEPGVPPAAAALGNAIFAATGQRLRQMPFARTVRFA